MDYYNTSFNLTRLYAEELRACYRYKTVQDLKAALSQVGQILSAKLTKIQIQLEDQAGFLEVLIPLEVKGLYQEVYDVIRAYYRRLRDCQRDLEGLEAELSRGSTESQLRDRFIELMKTLTETVEMLVIILSQ